jgi:hypothetical protein
VGRRGGQTWAAGGGASRAARHEASRAQCLAPSGAAGQSRGARRGRPLQAGGQALDGGWSMSANSDRLDWLPEG